jgi:hypothetical protein
MPAEETVKGLHNRVRGEFDFILSIAGGPLTTGLPGLLRTFYEYRRIQAEISQDKESLLKFVFENSWHPIPQGSSQSEPYRALPERG